MKTPNATSVDLLHIPNTIITTDSFAFNIWGRTPPFGSENANFA